MEPATVVGAWTLLSYEHRTPDHKISHPFGRRPRGYLLYTFDGMMSVAIMPTRRNEPPALQDAIARPLSVRSWLSLRRLRRLIRYVLSATRYISYSGPYTIRGDTIVHHIEVSQIPSLLGTDQERAIELRENRLILTAEIAGTHQCLTWERVAATSTSDAAAVGSLRDADA